MEIRPSTSIGDHVVSLKVGKMLKVTKGLDKFISLKGWMSPIVRCLEIRKPDGVVLLRDVGSVCKLEVDLNE